MKLKYLFDTNAVLVKDDDPNEIHGDYVFDFLGEKIIWGANNPGHDVVLEVTMRGKNYKSKIEKLLRFASLVVYRNSHVSGFRYVFHLVNAGKIGRLNSEAGIETRFLLNGNEKSFSDKMWSMLSFYLEAKNSSSFYYKFICLYKIIEIENLKITKRSGKKILEEDPGATKKYIESKIKDILISHEYKELIRDVNAASLRHKNTGEYFEHLFRDAFAHTGYLTRNNYKFGYPTMNPTNFDDYLRYEKVVRWFEEIAKKILRDNEPS